MFSRSEIQKKKHLSKTFNSEHLADKENNSSGVKKTYFFAKNCHFRSGKHSNWSFYAKNDHYGLFMVSKRVFSLDN